MHHNLPEKRRILFLFSDAGGGHRSAAEAIIEALHLEFGDAFSVDMVDVFKQFGPPIVRQLPDWYPDMVRHRSAWKLLFELTNGQGRIQVGMNLIYPYVKTSASRILKENPCDLIVTVHPGANYALLKLMKNPRPALISVVTELTNVHSVWYHRGVDLCIVPTQQAGEIALRNGLCPEQVRVIGLPVADRFCQPAGDRMALRRRLGWSLEKTIVLLVGGGEGMGPMESTAGAIASSSLPIELVVVTGRNRALRQRLESRSWEIPVNVFGFVSEMPDFMRAADILVTKGGPGTISEGLNAGLPVIVYTFLPGQEEGNISYIVENGAGVYATTSEQVVNTIQSWATHPDLMLRVAAASRKLANPGAARQIAHVLASYLDPSLAPSAAYSAL
jgi:1,2-diacylglycerol 3-beta-galactosyltransferase